MESPLVDYAYIWFSSFYPALDEEFLQVHCQFGGIDQRFGNPIFLVTIVLG